MQPEIPLGPLTLQTFGLCFAAAFIAAGAVVRRRLREWGRPGDWAYAMVFSGLFGLILLALAAVPLALGYAIGRIGCQLSGDCDYGQPWNGPWAMAYPDGT